MTHSTSELKPRAVAHGLNRGPAVSFLLGDDPRKEAPFWQ